MPLSGAERTRRYREKLKLERPEEYENQRKKNLEKIKSKKKKISELTPEEAENRREKWKNNKRISRQKQKKNKNLAILQDENTIPGSNRDTQENKLNDILIQKLRKKNKLLVNKCNRYMRYNEKIKRNLESHRKRFQRLKQKSVKDIEVLNLKIVKMKAREEILESTLKTTYQRCLDRKEKKTLRKLVTNSGNKSVISKLLGLKGKVREKENKLRRSGIVEITKFYTRDDVSRNTAGKKEVRTKNKEKVQIRYLLDTLLDTFKKYKAEGGRYSFTTFYLNKPFFVLSPGLSSRSTCLCVKHSNFVFLHSAMVKNGLVTGTLRDNLNQISCDINDYDCMWNKCLKCKNTQVNYQQISEEKLKQNVEWSRWERQDYTYQKLEDQVMKQITTKKTVRMTKKGTLNDLKKYFETELLMFKKHFFNMTHQQNQYKKAVNELRENEAVIVCDFSENYQAKLAEEIQSMHYGASNLQICLHTGMVFWKNRTQSFCTLSDNTSHQPAAIWAHLTPIIEMIKRETPETAIIHFFSDGPSAQYRQKKNFYLLVHYTKKYQLQYTTWSFYETGHGKNVADGIGGSIKRTLDRKVCMGNDVVDAKDAYNLLTQCLKVIKVFLIDYYAIENVSNDLPNKIPVLKGTMQIHQITTSQSDESFIIKYRDISCFCGDLRGQCACFSPKSHSVVISSVNINNSFKIYPSTTENLTHVEEISQNQKETEHLTNLEDGRKQVTNDPKMEAAHEFSSIFSSEFLEGLNDIHEPVDLNTINIDNLTITLEENDENLHRGKAKTEDPWQLFTVENEQLTTLLHTEEDLRLTATSHQISDVKQVSLNLSKEKEVSTKKRLAESHSFIDPKNVFFFKTPPVKRQSENLLIETKRAKSVAMFTKDNKVPASTLTKNQLYKKISVDKVQSKAIGNKVKILSNTNFLQSHKCSFPVHSRKGKCMFCKNWFCYECMVEPDCRNNYVCESCLELKGKILFCRTF
ncbi:unnamed protein product [Euphydryas editha]|uniref:Uncharacterized protein n=1 Tax=Euphydryas editha TaxID=104508 RepID=A0AAU9TH44_EUPED|nr:unnamed protein product [Euphydryas editha]